jgi:ABC-type multidrug transport system permease subunit
MAGKRGAGAEKAVDFMKIVAIMQKNFIVITRDRTRLFPLILFPVFMIIIFGYTSGTPPKHISTAIIAYDNGPLSEMVQQKIAESQVLSIRKVVSTEDEGRKLLDSGEVSVLVEIPSGFQKTQESGGITPITVIVDESDSSVASISKQTLSQIINDVSHTLGYERIASFQSSVAEAGQQLASQGNDNAQSYDAIAGKSAAAIGMLKSSAGLLESEMAQVESSITYPVALVEPSAYRNGGNYSVNVVFLSEPLTYAAGVGQLAFLSQVNGYVSAAEGSIAEAEALAEKSGQSLQKAGDYQNSYDNTQVPLQEINDFALYNPQALMHSVTYEEKPAYGQSKKAIDFLIPSIIALTIFQGAVMGMGRAVAGEKREGSLTRVFLTPTSNVTIILGTLAFYVIFEIFRAAFLILIAMNLFHIKIEGSLVAIAVILAIYTSVCTSIGLFLSSIVDTEQQYFAVSMLVSMPTLFLAGAFFPIQSLPKVLQSLAAFLPVTYAGEALRGVMIKGFSLATISYHIVMLMVFLAVVLGGTFMVFKRELA